jgi:AraC family L-rhamnose operon regulatory protein RhaS
MGVKTLKKIPFRPDPKFGLTAARHEIQGGFEEHLHDCVELVLVVKGSGSQLVDGRPCAAARGDVFVINPGVSHGFRDTKGLALCNVSYPQGFASGIDGELAQLEGFQALFVLGPSAAAGEFRSRLKLSFKELAWAERVVSAMIAETSSGAPGSAALAKAHFVELAIGLSRIYEKGGQALRNGPEGVAAAAKAASYLERHFAEPVSLAALAKSSGVSPRHLRRVFAKLCKASPMDYLMELRAAQAAELLESSELRVSEIAFRCGFGDGNYFARQFKRAAGLSPRQYRARFRKA